MDSNLLCTLLAQRIPPKQFQLWGLDIHWMSEDYDTPENRAIVADVIKNYDTLAAEYESLKEATDIEEAAIKTKEAEILRRQAVAEIELEKVELEAVK